MSALVRVSRSRPNCPVERRRRLVGDNLPSPSAGTECLMKSLENMRYMNTSGMLRSSIYTIYTTTRLGVWLQGRKMYKFITAISQIPNLQPLQQSLDLHRLFSATLLPASRNLLPDLKRSLCTNTLVKRAEDSDSQSQCEVRSLVLF